MHYIYEKFEIVISLWKVLSSKRKKQVIFLFLVNLFCAISELINIFFIRFYLDIIIDKTKLANIKNFFFVFQKTNENNSVLIIGCFLILFILFTANLRIFSIYLQYKVGPLLAVDLGSRIYNIIINKPYSWHIHSKSSSTIGILTYDVERIRESILASINILINGFILLFIFIPLFFIDPIIISLLVGIIIVLFGTIYKFNKSKLVKQGEIATINYESGLKMISESLDSIKYILIENNQKFFLNRYIEKFRNFNIAFGKAQTLHQAPKYIVESTLICLIIIISLFLNSSRSFQDINFPILGTILFGTYKLLIPFQQIFISFSLIKSINSSFKKINPYLKTKSTKTYQNKLDQIEFDNRIESKNWSNQVFLKLENVSFKYNSDSKFVIKNLNLSILKGQKVGFVGFSGAGKTTCGDIIAGLLKPTSGLVLAEGKDINTSKKHLMEWHNSFAIVPQKIFLMEDTIINNIAFGVPEERINFKKVLEVSKKACLHESINRLKSGYKYNIGEQGKKLSGGQIQRLAIARALYKDAKFIIFDEATSALDQKTEEIFMQSLENLNKDLTKILIAHRLSTITDCDFLVFFGKNLSIEIGKYNVLIEQSLEFRKFLNSDKLEN